jgi:hypothetical protein
MKHFAPFIACLLSLSIAAADQPHGGSWKDVRVTNMVTYTAEGYPPKGLVIVTLSANGTGTPSCANGYPKNLAIDITTDSGRTALAMVLSASTLGSTVSATGTGTCSVSSTTETMASIETKVRD